MYELYKTLTKLAFRLTWNEMFVLNAAQCYLPLISPVTHHQQQQQQTSSTNNLYKSSPLSHSHSLSVPPYGSQHKRSTVAHTGSYRDIYCENFHRPPPTRFMWSSCGDNKTKEETYLKKY